QATRHAPPHRDGDDALGGRPHIGERVALPWPRAGGIGMTAPEIGDATPLVKGGKGRTDLGAVVVAREVGGKLVTRRLETWRDGALDLCGHVLSPFCPSIARHGALP